MSFSTAQVVNDVDPVVPVVQTIGESAIDMISLPFGVTAPDTDYVQKSFAAYAAIGWGIFGTLVGEAWGNKRGRLGKKALVPLFPG
jgi:hypothetical protein